MDAAHWLPQSRPRLFVVAMRGVSGPVAAGPVAPFHPARVITAQQRLSGREAARLMGVPDTYILPRGETAALKLMGDAVAVPVVQALAEGLLRPALEGRAVSPGSVCPAPT